MFFSSKNLELKEKTYNAPDLRLEGYLVFFFYLVHISDPLLMYEKFRKKHKKKF